MIIFYLVHPESSTRSLKFASWEMHHFKSAATESEAATGTDSKTAAGAASAKECETAADAVAAAASTTTATSAAKAESREKFQTGFKLIIYQEYLTRGFSHL